jgi:hypothetical protein
MSARVLADGGSRDTAREMYRQMIAQSNDEKVKEMAASRLLQIDSFDERDAIRPAIAQYRESNQGRCPANWHDLQKELRAARVLGKFPLKLDENGAPVDPSGVAYLLAPENCTVNLDWKTSKVPYN